MEHSHFTGAQRLLDFLRLDMLYAYSAAFCLNMQFSSETDFGERSHRDDWPRNQARNIGAYDSIC